MANEVLTTTRPLVDNPKYVRINQKRLEKVAESFSKHRMKLPRWKGEVFPEENNEDLMQYMFLGNSINFAFTDFRMKKKYITQYNNKEWKGSFAMWAALKRALEDGIPVLDADYLSTMAEPEFRHIFRGNMDIPMLEERLEIFHEVGEVLINEFDGHFYNLVAKSQGYAHGKKQRDGMMERIVDNFHSFDDGVVYQNDKGKDELCIFDKRAQLTIAMLYGRFRNKGLFVVKDIDYLTVFADHVLPRNLRDMGILEYSKDLRFYVNMRQIIPANHRMEIEIRAATIHAADRMMKIINSNRQNKINAPQMDYKIWSMTKKQGRSPHHLTITTAY